MVGGPLKFKIGRSNLIECVVNYAIANEGIIFESCNSRSKIKPMEHYFAPLSSVKGNVIEMIERTKKDKKLKTRE